MLLKPKLILQSLHLASVLIVDLAIQRENSEEVSQASLKCLFSFFRHSKTKNYGQNVSLDNESFEKYILAN